jgi:hypothetical protein
MTGSVASSVRDTPRLTPDLEFAGVSDADTLGVCNGVAM